MRMRTLCRTGAWLTAAGCAVAGCGSDEMFTLETASNERVIDHEAVATLASPEHMLMTPLVVGDLDGDGIDDAIVSTRSWAVQGDTLVEGGDLYVVYGGSQLHGAIDLTTLPSLTITGVASGAVTALGDVDGDGLADFLVAAQTDGCGTQHSGAYLVYGSRTRLTGATPIASAAALLSDTVTCTDTATIVGIGDFDGDGKADFAISRINVSDNTPGDPDEVLVFYGRSQRLSGAVDLLATADAIIQEPVSSHNASFLVAAGDVDGDGHADLIVGTNTGTPTSNWRIELRLVLGSATRLSGVIALGDVAHTRLPDIACLPPSTGVGAGLGDLDGDGADEFSLVDCARTPTSELQTNFVHRVYYGRPGGLPAQLTTADAAAAFTTTLSDFISGNNSQLIGGDIDGDGVRDLILADQNLHGSNGGVHLIKGTAKRLSGTIDPSAQAVISYVGTPFHMADCGLLGIGVRDCDMPEMVGVGVSLGDLTGDHHPDLLVGAAVYFAGDPQGVALSPSHTYVVSLPALARP